MTDTLEIDTMTAEAGYVKSVEQLVATAMPIGQHFGDLYLCLKVTADEAKGEGPAEGRCRMLCGAMSVLRRVELGFETRFRELFSMYQDASFPRFSGNSYLKELGFFYSNMGAGSSRLHAALESRLASIRTEEGGKTGPGHLLIGAAHVGSAIVKFAQARDWALSVELLSEPRV